MTKEQGLPPISMHSKDFAQLNYLQPDLLGNVIDRTYDEAMDYIKGQVAKYANALDGLGLFKKTRRYKSDGAVERLPLMEIELPEGWISSQTLFFSKTGDIYRLDTDVDDEGRFIVGKSGPTEKVYDSTGVLNCSKWALATIKQTFEKATNQ